jgi:peptidoglycan glycosyltransferase
VNTSVVRLFAGILVLFAALVVATSWWTVVDAEELRTKPENRRVLLAEELIKRGIIRSADGTVLAASRKLSGDRFARRYPTGPLMAHPVGCTSLDRGRSGIEDYYNDPLTGRRTELIGAIDSLLGPQKIGDDLKSTLHTKAQEVAMRGLEGRQEKGAVVALDLKSGAVRVLAAKPTFDPERAECGATLNLATQGRFPPGSTMKTVTATAALDSGRYQPDSRVSGENGKEISGAPLNNFGNEDFGDITLTDALTNSVNTVWAEVAEKIGKGTMAEYMDRYGFYADPPMDYPDRQMVPSGVDKGRGGLVRPTSDSVDIGRVGIGQGDLQVTPLQMASVAQTIGNGGVRMKPRLVEKVIDPDGRTIDEPLPEEAQRVMSAETAAKLTDMMRKVVEEGTGTAAALQGVQVAGKTGTAELNLQGLNEAWFIGFTDQVAVAVVVDRVQGGTGGEIAAPIARDVLEALGQ